MKKLLGLMLILSLMVMPLISGCGASDVNNDSADTEVTGDSITEEVVDDTAPDLSACQDDIEIIWKDVPGCGMLEQPTIVIDKIAITVNRLYISGGQYFAEIVVQNDTGAEVSVWLPDYSTSFDGFTEYFYYSQSVEPHDTGVDYLRFYRNTAEKVGIDNIREVSLAFKVYESVNETSLITDTINIKTSNYDTEQPYIEPDTGVLVDSDVVKIQEFCFDEYYMSSFDEDPDPACRLFVKNNTDKTIKLSINTSAVNDIPIWAEVHDSYIYSNTRGIPMLGVRDNVLDDANIKTIESFTVSFNVCDAVTGEVLYTTEEITIDTQGYDYQFYH
ncbi:MAG: hypothetical protein IKL04_07010 [Lachnospiraceae bacterium]|nr:hypothetical protein [Lachnospiraceae bacterium]